MHGSANANPRSIERTRKYPIALLPLSSSLTESPLLGPQFRLSQNDRKWVVSAFFLRHRKPKARSLYRWSSPANKTGRHISKSRERILLPTRSPRVRGLRFFPLPSLFLVPAASWSGELTGGGSGSYAPSASAAGPSIKLLVISVVLSLLYRLFKTKLMVSHTHSEGLTAPRSSKRSTSESKIGCRSPNSVVPTEGL